MTTTAIGSIQLGIIYLIAEWSGDAKWAHRQLVEFLEQRHIPAERLLVLDVDHHPELYDLTEFAGRIHGWGEVAVIKAGRIVFVTVLGKHRSQFQQHCEELVRVYDTEPDAPANAG
jgi:hypothetical protein